MLKPFVLSVIAATAVASAALAQTTVVTPPPPGPPPGAPGAVVTTTPGSTQVFMGTVTEVNPTSRTLILTAPDSPSPVTYTYAPDTVFVDQQGRTVTYDAVRNSSVRVEYSSDGGTRIVRRVVVTPLH